MAAFPCKKCKIDLVDRIEEATASIRSMLDLEGELPEEFVLAGRCPECRESYSFDGDMFTHYMNTKMIEETDVDPDLQEAIKTEAVFLTKEEAEYLNTLIKEERFDEVDKFLQELVDRDEEE